MASAVALASAGVLVSGTAASAHPGVDMPVREAELSTVEATAGENVTVRSVGPGCLAGPDERAGLVWAVFPHGAFVWGDQHGWDPADAITSGTASPQASPPPGGQFGSWSLTFPAPDASEIVPGDGEIGPGTPATSWVYGPLPFTVDGEHQFDFVAKCYTFPRRTGDIEISPAVPERGGSATVTALDPCPMPHTQGGSVAVELWDVAADAQAGPDIDIDIKDLGPVDVADDGSWSLTLAVPDRPDRAYGVNANCMNVEGGNTLGYWLTPFDVRDAGGPPVETPPGVWDRPSMPPVRPDGPPDEPIQTAGPAQPVRAEPTYTG